MSSSQEQALRNSAASAVSDLENPLMFQDRMALQAALAASGPKLQITRQEDVTSEHFSIKNGISKQVHVVVKNLTFPIELSSTFDLSKANMVARLLYDFDKEDEEKTLVPFVKSEPLDYKVNVLDGGLKASVELKIKVLTSQHEDMLFRVHFVATDPETRQELHVFSQPIKVISKVTQVKKGKENHQTGSPAPFKGTPTAKRTTSDVSQTLEDFRRQQEEHTRLLLLIKRKLFGQEDSSGIASLSESAELESLQLLDEGRVKQETADFETSFRNFLAILHLMQPEEKQAKVDAFLSSLTAPESEKLQEFISLLDSSHTQKKRKTRD